MAKQTIRIISDPECNVVFEHYTNFRTIAESVADVWKMVNGLLINGVKFGGSFGNERHIVLHSEHYVVAFTTERGSWK